MKEQLAAILAEVQSVVLGISERPQFETFKATISGPKGKFTELLKGMRDVPAADKPVIGKLVNETKQKLQAFYDASLQRIAALEMAAQLGPCIDPTLPSPDTERGALHPLTQARRRIEAIFHKIGFTVAEGPEVETEWYCFDALNTAEDHPARDAQDTLFLEPSVRFGNVSRHDERATAEAMILRTHTSSVQIRTMLREKPPLRIISPGRVFRRDSTDATHSANFHQVEGLAVDEKLSICDLKAVLDFFVKEIFGNRVKTRLRPSFFPFTEPSFELDILSPSLGKLSNTWIEIMGCGMVDPHVFQAVGYDPTKWTGYAFGMGIERIAMILHGIDDIRLFYQNDLRFLRQFR